MKSLSRLSTDNLVTEIIKGTISIKRLDDLDWKSCKMVTDKLFSYDLEIWKRNIMKSLSLIELKKCKDYNIEWKKIYIDGTRDFREILYIFHDGDESYVDSDYGELTEDEFDDEFEPKIKVTEINEFNDHYYSYFEALSYLND